MLYSRPIGRIHSNMANFHHIPRKSIKLRILTFSFTEIVDFMLIIGVIWIASIKKIEFWIAQFILSNTCLKFWPISCNKTGSFIDNILTEFKSGKYICLYQWPIRYSVNYFLKEICLHLKGYFSPLVVDK